LTWKFVKVLAAKVGEEVAVEVAEEVGTEREPIRVDSKLDTRGNSSRTGN
jgi:hypothetical protein